MSTTPEPHPTPTGPADTLPLRGGVRIPALGPGVFRSPAGRVTQQAVTAALDVGYRHIDTAAVYGNEADVGHGVRESGLDREQVFITTKLWNADHGYQPTLDAFERSRRLLGVDHIDLYLVHWPVPGKRLETWRAMEHLLETGKARAIGVSNYMTRHLEELLDHAQQLPSVNQFEISPKSTHADRVAGNADAFGFTLTDAEMETLDALDENLVTAWDPTTTP
ncbi:aldo/keto reductase [Streptomyces sp. NPDC091215]|uniref:aldo/keto reductase n=1 Tax=Streptomyces sp. NPDC091215 TaxID=3155192 RepID=UPI003429B006